MRRLSSRSELDRPEADGRAGGRWTNGFLLLSGCLVALLLAESLAALVLWIEDLRHYSPTSRYHNRFPVFDDPENPAGIYMAHPYTAYEMKPDYLDKTNSLGLRGPEIEREKRPGTLRVVCLGGSTTYSVRNEYEFSYPKLLGDELTTRLGPRVEVINAGLVSATTADSVHRLINKILPLEPDMVILYHAVNDLGPRVVEDTAPDYSNFRRVPLDPFYGLYPILNRVHLVRLLKTTLHREYLVDYIIDTATIPESEPQRIENFHRNGTVHFERNLDLMIRLLLSYDIQPVVPTFAFHPSPPDKWMPYVPDDLWEEGIGEHNEVIRRLNERHGLVSVPFDDHARGHAEWFNGRVHMTDLGSEEKARFFADRIEVSLRARLVAPEQAVGEGRPSHTSRVGG